MLLGQRRKSKALTGDVPDLQGYAGAGGAAVDLNRLDNRSLPRIPEPATADVPLGLTVRDLIGRLEVPDSVHGVIVSRVDPTGAAFSASIRRGFVIMEINRRAIRSLTDYRRAVATTKPGDVLALYCYDPTLQQRTLITVAVE